MNSKYSTNGLSTNAQGIAPIDWMVVISIAGVLIYLFILIYHVNVVDTAMSKQFSQVFGVTACYAGLSIKHADTAASLRGGQHTCAKSLKRLQGQAPEIADFAFNMRHANDAYTAYTLHVALFESKLSLYRRAITIKTRLLQHNWIPVWSGMACCNRGAIS